MVFSLWISRANRKIQKTQRIVIFLGIVVLIVLFTPLSDQLIERFAEIKELNAHQQQEFQSSSIVAGRTNAWGTHLNLIASYPLSGIYQGESWDFGEYGVATIGESGIYGAAHNTVSSLVLLQACQDLLYLYFFFTAYCALVAD